MTAQPRRRRLRSGGIELALTDWGDSDDPVMLALHGFPESAATWGPLAELLAAAGRRVVAPDLRGFGLSDAPRSVRSYRFRRLLDDVESVIHDLDCGPVAVVGHDWGGGLAWLLAERRPHLVARATILNVPHPAVLRRAILHDPEQRKRSSYIIKMQVPVVPERRLLRGRGEALAVLFPSAHYSADTIEEYRAGWMRPGVMRGMLNWYRAAARDFSLRIPSTPIEPPIEIIWGRNDPLFIESLVDASAALCRNVSIRYLECGHAPHREIPAAVAEILLGEAG